MKKTINEYLNKIRDWFEIQRTKRIDGKIKGIETKADTEYLFELYKVRYELLKDEMMQLEWLLTDEGKAANGTEKAELDAENKRKSILAYKEQLDFIKTKL